MAPSTPYANMSARSTVRPVAGGNEVGGVGGEVASWYVLFVHVDRGESRVRAHVAAHAS